MRIKFDKPADKDGYNQEKKRTKTKFLFFPKKINYELRWLEKATWIQKIEYKVKLVEYSTERKYYWNDVDWLDRYIEQRGDNKWLDL